MPEADTIFPDSLPLTVQSIAEQLRACGLQAGQTVLVHSSMSSLGWISGGAVAVIQALLQVLGEDGTLMMPTHTTSNTEPKYWQNPPVPAHWWPIIREHRPAYDPTITPTRMMGAIAELFRTWPGAIRSAHPAFSFAAIGPNAAYLTAGHSLEDGLGEASPIGKLYELDGYVLLLGVPHSNNTSLHLAEYRADWPGKRTVRQGAAMLVDGERRWVEYDDLDLDADDFQTIGAAYERQIGYTPCRVGRATVRFLRQRPLVDFAVEYMNANRK
ncbi:MAG: aminoglycoside N(3)-acetyltransferase [Chloroflexi bacterium]|nr:MAG: aminoglycoside N(3)-acetyltransferase [Chloroflexota bacterium]